MALSAAVWPDKVFEQEQRQRQGDKEGWYRDTQRGTEGQRGTQRMWHENIRKNMEWNCDWTDWRAMLGDNWCRNTEVEQIYCGLRLYTHTHTQAHTPSALIMFECINTRPDHLSPKQKKVRVIRDRPPVSNNGNYSVNMNQHQAVDSSPNYPTVCDNQISHL